MVLDAPSKLWNGLQVVPEATPGQSIGLQLVVVVVPVVVDDHLHAFDLLSQASLSLFPVSQDLNY